MCNDSVQMNTSLDSVLVFILLLRQLLSRPYVRWNQAGTWSFSEKKSPLKFCYRRDNPGPNATDGALGRTWLLSELSARENMVSLEALNAIDCLPVLEDLESEPTKVELKEAMRYLHLEKRAARMAYHNDERRKHSHSIQKQGGQKSLQQLSRHLTPQYRYNALCSSRSQGSPSARREILSWVIVWFPCQTINTILGLIACPARQSIWSVWPRLRRNGPKHYLQLNHLFGSHFLADLVFFSFFAQSRAI